MPFTIFDSPLGQLTLIADADGSLRHLYFPGTAPALESADYDPDALAAVSEQLEQYFRGERTQFELTLDYDGTVFQRSVWDALRTIEYGTTTTYGALARELDAQPRAVGSAVGATPIPIVIPCHRVIGSDGSLTGYGGGLPRKRALLDLEAGVLPLAPA
ncbi:MAG TPA: methylated-DNA--[protein]-cysteine S-methyltransferase [Solirubrobacteraceae bacterium]|nr:methylated-DNA--[protein]-cysteine S-methyltransferase [Solirubrobacteraceae bacterium]